MTSRVTQLHDRPRGSRAPQDPEGHPTQPCRREYDRRVPLVVLPALILPCYPYRMSDQQNDDDQRRDALLRRLLKTPPQPRPKRERSEGKPKANRARGKRAIVKREPSA